jgi:hypothetical protein
MLDGVLGVLVITSVVLSNTQIFISFKQLLKLIVVSVLFTIFVIIHEDYWNQNSITLKQLLLLIIFIMFGSVILFNHVSFDYFAKLYSNVIASYGLFSLVLWLLIVVLNKVNTTTMYAYDWGTKRLVPSFHNVFFLTQLSDLFSFPVYRNSGIWCEAPMFVLVISFAWVYELFVQKKMHWVKTSILGATLISTLSSTAFILVIISIGIKTVTYVSHFRANGKKLLTVLFPIVLIIGTAVAVSMFAITQQKIASSSGSVRWDDYVAGYRSFIHAPIVGHGFENSVAIQKYMNFGLRESWDIVGQYYNLGLANSWSQILSDGGILFFGVFVFPIIYAAFFSKSLGDERVIFKFIIGLMFALIMNYTPIFIVCLGYAINNKDISVEY